MAEHIHHQFSLFKPEETKPVIKIPIKRISKERAEEVMKLYRKGKPGSLLKTLEDINDSLERYIKKKGL